MFGQLLNHPEFQAGVTDAQAHFSDCHGPTPLTQDEMIDEVEGNLSRRVISDSYFYDLGYVYGTIDEGLKEG